MSAHSSMRFAMIGLGNIAPNQLEALKVFQRFDLVAVCDIDTSKQGVIREFSQDIPFYLDHMVLLNEHKVDAVLVSTPYTKHYEVALSVLESHSNLLLEKPATQSLHEFEHLISTANGKEIVFSVAFHAAFAKDLEWFISKYESDLKNTLGEITGFKCGFYDPYIKKGILQSGAKSLGSSWVDSGINALSVVGKLVKALRVEEARLSYIEQYDTDNVQASVDFSFSIDGSDRAGHGLIETNWTLDLNRKVTSLYFGKTGYEIVLHHSNQQVILVDTEGKAQVLVDFSDEYPRLVNHYIGVFNQFHSNLVNKSSNIDFALPLHQLLYSAFEEDRKVSICH